MKNELLDIVHAISVVPFDVVKVTGNNGDVTLQSKLLQDESTGAIIFRAKLTKKVPEFDGVFGLSNISMLSGLANTPQFSSQKEGSDAKITMKRLERNGVKIPEEIVFEKPGFCKASYRLTGEKAIPPQMKEVAEIKWNVEIDAPSITKISQLATMAGIYSSQETKISVKTENRQLKFLIGDENSATHKASFVFEDNVTGTIKPNHTWSISGILAVLKSGGSGKTTLKISDQGILQIEITTAYGVYTYIFAGTN